MFQPPDHYRNVSLQLSEVLDDIGVNQRLIEKRKRAFLLIEGLKSVCLKIKYKNTLGIYYFGSQTEGSTTVGLYSDIDCLLVDSKGKVIPDWSEWEPFDGPQFLMLQDQTTNPGYCLLQCVRPDVPLPVQDIQSEHLTTDCRENCPHFIISGNNLLRGKLSPGIKQRLAGKLCDLTGDIVRALTGVRIDDLGIRLNIKFGQVIDIALPSKDEIYKMVVLNNYKLFVRYLNLALYKILNDVSACRDIHGKLRHCIFLMCQIHTVGSVFEKKVCMLLMSHLFTTLGSVIASDDIAQGRGLSPESLTWFAAGLDSDVATSRLKLTSALYCTGEFGRCEVILNELETKLTSLHVSSFCPCSGKVMEYREFAEDICDTNEEEVIQENTTVCVKYLPSETCIPVELKYELFRSTGDDVQYRGEGHYWMNWATVDALPYLYFLQYKVYKQLHKPVDQRRALDNLASIIYSDPELGHKETALNILGQCYEQENNIHYAMCCNMMSLNVRNRNNAAKWHICRILAAQIRQLSGTYVEC